MSKVLNLYTCVCVFVRANSSAKILKFNSCQKGTAVVEHSLLAAFVVGGVLSGSSYMTHDAVDGENALLGVFMTASVGSMASMDRSDERKDGVMITE